MPLVHVPIMSETECSSPSELCSEIINKYLVFFALSNESFLTQFNEYVRTNRSPLPSRIFGHILVLNYFYYGSVGDG